MAALKEWYRDNFMISTSPSLIQPAAVNDAYASDMMYWTKRLDESILKQMLSNSLCLGVYELPSSSSEIAGRQNPRQIGLARVVTDYTSFALVADVYILPGYQGKGLGSWLVQCLNETVETWPELKRILLFSTDKKDFYFKNLGMESFDGKGKVELLTKRGPGTVFTY